jgi:hypothetical protein
MPSGDPIPGCHRVIPPRGAISLDDVDAARRERRSGRAKGCRDATTVAAPDRAHNALTCTDATTPRRSRRAPRCRNAQPRPGPRPPPSTAPARRYVSLELEPEQLNTTSSRSRETPTTVCLARARRAARRRPRAASADRGWLDSLRTLEARAEPLGPRPRGRPHDRAPKPPTTRTPPRAAPWWHREAISTALRLAAIAIAHHWPW